MATKVDIRIEQGSRFERIFLYCQPLADDPDDPDPAAPVDVTGWGAKLQIRDRPGGTVLLEASSDDASILVGEIPGGFRVLLSGTATAALTRNGVYDLLGLPPADASPERVAEGAAFVDLAVTTTAAPP